MLLKTASISRNVLFERSKRAARRAARLRAAWAGRADAAIVDPKSPAFRRMVNSAFRADVANNRFHSVNRRRLAA